MRQHPIGAIVGGASGIGEERVDEAGLAALGGVPAALGGSAHLWVAASVCLVAVPVRWRVSRIRATSGPRR